jgi:hypothetical protein
MTVNVSDDDINQVFNVLGEKKQRSDEPVSKYMAKSLNQEVHVVRIRKIADRTKEIGQLPTLPNYVLKSKDDKTAKAMSGQGSSQVSAFENEKKYKKNLQALTSQIEEREKRLKTSEAEIQIYLKDIKSLQNKLE